MNVIFHYFTIAYALNLHVSAFYFFLIVPVVTIVLMLPLFINGIGGRELVYIFLFGQFGVARADAIAFSWISFGMVLIQGVIGGVMLGLGRALGETMAVTFVIGNANRMPTSLFSPGTSIASTLANEFGEAADFHLSTLFALGFLLFVITFVVLSAAKIMLLRAEKAKGL